MIAFILRTAPRVDEDVVDHQREALLLGQRDQLFGLGDRARERLLDRTCLPRSSARLGRGG